MLHILLLILKIIGIILLILLALIFLILGIILFVPIRYEASGEKYEKLKAVADVTWFFKLVQIHVSFQNKKLKYYVRIAWKKLIRSDDEDEVPEVKEPEADIIKTSEESGQKQEEISQELSVVETVPDEVVPEADAIEETVPDEVVLEETDLEEAVPDETVLKETTVDEEFSDEYLFEENVSVSDKKIESEPELVKEKVSLKEKIRNVKAKIIQIKDKITGFFTNTQKSIDNVKKKYNKLKKKADIYYRFITNDITKAALNHIKKEVFYLLRHFLPKKIDGDVCIGFEDPATTGKVLGYICVVNALLRQPMVVRYNFEEKVMEGKLHIKGHIRLCHGVKAVLALVIDRNIWRTIKRFKKLRRR